MPAISRGWFAEGDVDYYLEKSLDRGGDEDLEYFYAPSSINWSRRPQQVRAVRGRTTNISLKSVANTLCLDVGAWAGNGPNGAHHHRRHRDFGIVCENVAVLCSYCDPVEGAPATDPSKNHADMNTKKLDQVKGYCDDLVYERIRDLIEHLSGNSKLGGVHVINARAVQVPLEIQIANEPADPSIHVFLGDLHLPVVARPPPPKIWHTLGEPPPSPPNKDPIPRAGRLNLGPELYDLVGMFVDSMDVEQVKIDDVISAIEKTVKDDLKSGSLLSTTALPSLMIMDWWSAFGVAGKVGRVVTGLYEKARDKRIEKRERFVAAMKALESIEKWPDGQMSFEEASDWNRLYLGDRELRTKGADISEGAADDLCIFIDRLVDWHLEHKEEEDKAIHLIQLGDFYDFWIGLKRGFHTGDGEYDWKRFWLSHEGQLFARHWRDETAKVGVGNKVVGAFERAEEMGLDVHRVYGNHDNYMNQVGPWRDHYQPKRSLIYAEHGHQSDSFNWDGGAESGWAITQAVFVIPSLRDFEELASTLMTMIGRCADPRSSLLPERLERVAHGVDTCYDLNRQIYVMGHTHRPFLRRVLVRQGDRCAFAAKRADDGRVTCYYDENELKRHRRARLQEFVSGRYKEFVKGIQELWGAPGAIQRNVRKR